MSDHYFSIKPGEATQRKTASVTVDTSTTAGSSIELRVTDGAVTAKQVYDALEWLADLFASRNTAVIPTDMLTG